MIDILLFLGRQLLVILPCMLFLWLNAKANLPQDIRNRQFLMPILTLCYSIICLLLLEDINDLMASFLEALPKWVESLGLWVSSLWDGALDQVGQWFVSLSDSLEEGIAGLHLKTFLVFLSNAFLLIVHLILKRLCVGILSRIFCRDGKIHNFAVSFFYEKNAQDSNWYLQERFVQCRTYLEVLYIAITAISIGCLQIAVGLYDEGILRAPFYPFFGVVILGELFFFLNARTCFEKKSALRATAAQARRICNYSLMRKVLKGLFPDKLNAENVTINSGLSNPGTNDEILLKYESDPDPAVNIYGQFMRQRQLSGLQLDQNYITSGYKLLKGESILFNNPFYYDLMPYMFYPMNRSLLRQKKVLIILGRHGAQEDAKLWCTQGLTQITNVPTMWRIGILNGTPQELDVGIITRSDVHDLQLHESNDAFLKQVEFVVLLEPSRLLTTAQIGLHSIVQHCRHDNASMVFCSSDKNCDGLVDALSHILMTSLTEVSATGHHSGLSTYMCWDADNEPLQHRMLPNLSHFLGMGTELSFMALKNQISKTYWYGGDSFPVKDMRWIAQQYYHDLLSYAALPTNQDAVDAFFAVSDNLYKAQIEPYKYVTVEDESFNMFEMRRNFATRATAEGFTNILSGEYLLKDYMAANDGLFDADPKAIPYIVADYARTARNVVLRLLLRMSYTMVTHEELARELSLLGVQAEPTVASFWQELCACFQASPVSGTDQLLHCAGRSFDRSVIVHKKKYSMQLGKMQDVYTVEDEAFIKATLGDLQSAQYITEDEYGAEQYLGAEVRGQIFQKYLPGQFLTFCGKYYEMLRVTESGKVLLRRAADHIDGRSSYRQNRTYYLSSLRRSEVMGDQRSIGELKIAKEYADIRVVTHSYWSLERYNDFATGNLVEINGIPERKYSNKAILKITLPDGVTPEIRQTVTLLFNEVFRTLFAENQPYICALCSGETERPLTYALAGEDGTTVEENCIYIVEDCQLDIGLLVAVERNLKRIFAIVCDYLNWHMDAMAHQTAPDPVVAPASSGNAPTAGALTPVPAGKEGFLKRTYRAIGNFFRKLFRRKKSAPLQGTAQVSATATVEGGETVAAGTPFAKAPYQKRHYLLYGGSEACSNLDLTGTLELLEALGYAKSALYRARTEKDKAKELQHISDSVTSSGHHCDFCGVELVGTEYDVLADGRERCCLCGRNTVKTLEEFEAIYDAVIHNMSTFFGAYIRVPVQIQMVDAQKIHRHFGKKFVPTHQMDGRVLGFAQKDRNGYTIMLENGAPRLQAIMTLVHELTHIWQYTNWDAKEIVSMYGKKEKDEIYEGMAKWSEIQFAYLLKETATAKREELRTRMRSDEYGRGFIRFAERYPLSEGIITLSDSPFTHPDRPL